MNTIVNGSCSCKITDDDEFHNCCDLDPGIEVKFTLVSNYLLFVIDIIINFSTGLV
jgi:hypothetical protein